MPGDSDEELRRVSSGWGRRPPKPPADPYTIERDPPRTGVGRGGEGERPSGQDEAERAREKDEELRLAGGAGAISGPASSREASGPQGLDPGEAPEPREG